GAYTALALALDHPQLVRSLVLAEPPIFPLLTASEAGDSARRAFYTYSLDPARAAFAHGDSVAGIRLFFDVGAGRGALGKLPAGVRAELLACAFVLRHGLIRRRVVYVHSLELAS